ncbi:exodeoxyribonuclease I [Alteromonas confluentis]|uniref:Exodeoxyribonuclease I n=1 Tax=Alteromonas confluentis TaxID=1656094 RepID=A0A1E7ZGR6_9ALTE|nr:exodeoxyribonuclease I [Alteromonas confluentis]OFC72644.1 exodeoxyribonuclease I [Alteromonas confluentis]
MTQNTPSLLWYDFESWGANPLKDSPCQFAAIRTDMALNVVGKPINIMAQIANDTLPQPQACLITGITPQQSLRDGMTEAEFARKIAEQMSQPNTCVVGYNSIRFDDEMTRSLLYRNFYDPYSREWRNGNSRWDIIDLARACYALRPDGITWPTREDGSPIFKLEALTKANDLEHGQAHDALSDVRATIALAKLIKQHQPKLYDYAFSLRSKQNVMKQIDVTQPSVVLHVSSRLPASQGCTTWVMPVAMHPTNANAVIAVDLSQPVDMLLENDAETLREKLYTSAEDLGDTPRPGLKLIHINRSPFVTTAKAMTEENAARLGLNREQCLQNYKTLANYPDLQGKLSSVYNQPYEESDDDADHTLYSGGFLSDADRRWCDEVRETPPELLDRLSEQTQNSTLRTLLFRYRARNFPTTLTADELHRWQAHRQYRLTDKDSPATITLEPFLMELEQLAHEHENDPDKQAILRALYTYAQNL